MNLLGVVTKWQIKERGVGYDPLGNGHINSTYLVKTKSDISYVLQKINDVVFKDVD